MGSNSSEVYDAYIQDVQKAYSVVTPVELRNIEQYATYLTEDIYTLVSGTRVLYQNIVKVLQNKNKHLSSFNINKEQLSEINIPELISTIGDKLLTWTESDKENLISIIDTLKPHRYILYEALNACIKVGITSRFRINKLKRTTGVYNNDELLVMWNKMVDTHTVYNSRVIEPLCYSCLPLVINRAKTFNLPFLQTEDKIAYGNEGLLKAAHRFDFSRGVTFQTYAMQWITQSIMEGGSTELCSVKVPTQIKQIYFSKNEQTEESKNIINCATNTISIHADDDDENRFPFDVADVKANAELRYSDKCWDAIYQNDFKTMLEPVEYAVFGMAYGVFDYEQLSIAKIAERFKTTRFFVEKHITSAKSKIKQNAGIMEILTN